MDRSIILRIIAAVSAIALLGLLGCGGDLDVREHASGGAPEPRISRTAIEQSLAAAEAYFQADDLPKAEAILLTLIDRAPAEAAAHEMHGQVLLAQAADARAAGDIRRSNEFARRAYERYEHVIEHSPPSAGLHHSAGDVAQMAGLDEQALAHYTQAMRLDPNQPRHAIFAAQLLAQAQQFEEAEHALRSALALDPDEPIAHASLANVAMQQERFDEALSHIREARSIRPGDPSFRVIEAAIHRRSGDPRGALQLLIGLSPVQQAMRSVAREMAENYALLGDHAAAAEVWMHSFRAGPDEPEAWRAALGAAANLLEADRRSDAGLWLTQARISATQAGDREAASHAITQLEERMR